MSNLMVIKVYQTSFLNLSIPYEILSKHSVFFCPFILKHVIKFVVVLPQVACSCYLTD